MNQRKTEIARQLVAHERWGWRPWMRILCTTPGGGAFPGRIQSDLNLDFGVADEVLPDLDDDATAGVLFGMLVEVAGFVEVYNVPGPSGGIEGSTWETRFADGRERDGLTRGEALAKALLVVWSLDRAQARQGTPPHNTGH